METENAHKILGGISDHQLVERHRQSLDDGEMPEYDNGPRAEASKVEEESMLHLRLLSLASHENEVINSSHTVNNNSFAQSVTKKLSLLFEPSPIISANHQSSKKTSAVNQDLAEIVSEFSGHIDKLRPLAEIFKDFEGSREFKELVKVVDVCYRPYFWAVAQSSERMMSMIQHIQSELDSFEQSKGEYETFCKENNKQLIKLSSDKQMTEDEIRIVSSALEQSKAVEHELESQLVELEVDGDQLRNVALAVDELQNLNKDVHSIKKSLRALEDKIEKLNCAINKVKFEASNFTISLYEYEQSDFDFDDLLVKLKHFPVALGLMGISVDCPILPKFDCSELFGMLDDHLFSEKTARRYLNDLLTRVHDYICFAQNLELKLVEDLARVEQKIADHPLKHYRIFQSKILNAAFNLLRSVDDAENASASFELRLGSLNEKLERLSHSLSEIQQRSETGDLMLALKEHEDYILATIDELNRTGSRLVIADLQDKKIGQWIVCWIMIVSKFKVDKLLRTFDRLHKLAASDRPIKNVTSIWSKALAFQSNMRSLIKSVPFEVLIVSSETHSEGSVSREMAQITAHLKKEYETLSFNFSKSLIRPSIISHVTRPSADGYTIQHSHITHGNITEEFSTVATAFSKKFVLHPSVRDSRHLRFFGLARFLLNGVEVYWRRPNGEFSDVLSPKKTSGQSGVASAKKETRNLQSNTKQPKDKAPSVTRHFNPFLAKQYPPESCGYSKCIFLLDLSSDAFNFIEDDCHHYISTHSEFTPTKSALKVSESIHNQTQRKQTTRRQRVSCLPLVYFWKPLVSVNTQDYLAYLQKQGNVGSAGEREEFMEISLSNVKYQRVDLVAKSVPLFTLLYEFLGIQATDPKIYQTLKSKILLDI